MTIETPARSNTEKAALQVVVAVLAAVPVLAGLEGILDGPAFLGVLSPWPADLDSHLRYLSGVLLAIGIAWYWCIPDIEMKAPMFRFLAGVTICGGIGRFVSLLAIGPPSTGHRVALVVELLVVPLLVLWQARIAQTARRG